MADGAGVGGGGIGAGNGAGGGGIKFADRAMPMRKAAQPGDQEKKLRQAAGLYEEQFLREMVKAMRQTVQEGGFMKAGPTEKLFREQLDQQYVEKWAAQGGVGLGNMIYEQMVQNFGVKMGLKAPVQKPVGPLAFDEKSRLMARPVSAPSASKLAIEFYAPDLDKPTDLKQAAELRAPWEARVTHTRRLESGETLMEMSHPNGLRSQFAFRGSAIAGLQDLKMGEAFGQLDPAASKNFFWNLSKE